MGNSEKFCLRWNDFESNISTAFRELRDDKDFFDVTLVCDEDQIQAHKVILSACSPFFRSVLRRNRHEHPLLYMKGIKYLDIVSVLNFMYHGEVSVAQEDLNSFLAVAEDLKVKGLTQNDSDNSSKVNQIHTSQANKVKTRPDNQPSYKPPAAPPIIPQPKPPVPVQRKYQPSPKYTHEVDHDEIQEVVPIKAEPGSMPGTIQSMEEEYVDNTIHPGEGVVADPNNTIYGDEYADYSNYEAEQSYDEGTMAQQSMATTVEGNQDVDALLASFMQKILDENQVQVWQCIQCGKTSRYITNMKDHVEAKHLEGLSYSCPECHKTSKSKQSLRAHMKTAHNLSSKVLKQSGQKYFS